MKIHPKNVHKNSPFMSTRILPPAFWLILVHVMTLIYLYIANIFQLEPITTVNTYIIRNKAII